MYALEDYLIHDILVHSEKMYYVRLTIWQLQYLDVEEKFNYTKSESYNRIHLNFLIWHKMKREHEWWK